MDKNKSPYYTNPEARKKIDELLCANSKIWCNLGTGSALDPGTRKQGEIQWKSLAKEIKSLDAKFYKVVCPYGIDS
tara:strand:+ start:317 stop:544 length:228 start_codon:yes stop_codon:yes gene_type:complete